MDFYVTTVHGTRRLVGQLDGSVFTKVVMPEHFFRKSRAWGLDEEVVRALAESDCRIIRLYARDEGKTYEVDFDTYLRKSWLHTYKGFQPQRFLTLKYWTIKDNDNQTIKEGLKDLPKKSQGKQNSLFGYGRTENKSS